MEINVDSLKKEISSLNKLIDDYELIYFNLYNEFSSLSSYWKDKKSSCFFSNVNEEKLKVKKVLDDVVQVRDIYNFLINEYQKFGDNLRINLENRDIILDKYNDYLSCLDDLISCYDNLRYISSDIKTLDEHKIKLATIKEKVLEIKAGIIADFNNIEAIEKEVSYRISKIKIGIIKETDIKDII